MCSSVGGNSGVKLFGSRKDGASATSTKIPHRCKLRTDSGGTRLVLLQQHFENSQVGDNHNRAGRLASIVLRRLWVDTKR
jgi:hypothetical protein